ncbi:hypothetical protein C8J56DRAFT_902767 [Mycena floridula]|nr:hypothetical protein C8J56DRAFT_902767 [Mycena floridula]
MTDVMREEDTLRESLTLLKVTATTKDRIDLKDSLDRMIKIITVGMTITEMMTNRTIMIAAEPKLEPVNLCAMQKNAEAGPSNGPETAEVAAATANEQAERVSMEVQEHTSGSECCLSENWSQPMPFSWNNPDEITVTMLQGDMLLSMQSLIELVNYDETIVRIIEPGFDKTDSMGLIQLFYGYDQELLPNLKEIGTRDDGDELLMSYTHMTQKTHGVSVQKWRHLSGSGEEMEFAYSVFEELANSSTPTSLNGHYHDQSECYLELKVEEDKFNLKIECLSSVRATGHSISCEEVEDESAAEDAVRKKRKVSDPDALEFVPE